MAQNNLTPEQDLLTREFFQKVSNDKSLFPDDPVGQRNMNQCILRLLNYDYINGAYITKGQTLSRSLTGSTPVECEWMADTVKAQKEYSGNEDSGSSKDKADSGKPTKNTKVRKAVLREDV